MNKRIAAVLASAASLLLGPSALAAPVGAAADHIAVGDPVLDHGQGGHDEGEKGHQGQDDHDHDGDGRPDHDPEDHDEDEAPKPKDDHDEH